MPHNAIYIWSPRLQAVADQLPANLGRSSMVHGLVNALGLVMLDNATKLDDSVNGRNDPSESLARVVVPDLSFGTPAELKRYHDSRYVDYLLSNRDGDGTNGYDSTNESSSSSSSCSNRTTKRRRATHGLEHDCPPFSALREYALLVSASTMTACRLLARGDTEVAIVWDGGRHHALRSRASGFCYVADAVLGILLLAREGVPRIPRMIPSTAETSGPTPSMIAPTRRARILYLDLDLHYGDGVAQAFHSPAHFPYPIQGSRCPRPPQVLTLSIHHSSPIFFPPPSALSILPDPSTPHPFSLAVPLAAYAHIKTYARIWEVCVERVFKAFEPDYIVLQLGVDGLPRDSVGQYGAWGVNGIGSSTWVVEQVKQWKTPTCVLGGGGYNHANAARAWALATASLIGKDMPAETCVPVHDYIDEYAPSFTLEVDNSDVPDENRDEVLQEIERVYTLLGERIREILSLHR